MKETIFNLQCDWDGILRWHGVKAQGAIREIKEAVAFEVDQWRHRSLIKRILNRVPEWKPFVDENKEINVQHA